MKIILPKTHAKPEFPLIYLAGPIRSAPEWQDKAIELLLSVMPDCTVANPRRYVSKTLQEYVAKCDNAFFPRQRAWERHYMEIAATEREGGKTKSALLFYLPAEEKQDRDKVYGHMTQYELGEWITRYELNPKTSMVIGADQRYPELGTVTYDISSRTNLTILNGLEETVREAARIVKS